DERGEDAPHPAPVEPPEGEAGPSQVLEDDARDEEARNDEEHVDAGEAAGRRARESVERHDRQDGDGAQPVDVGPVGMRIRRGPHSLFQAAGLSACSCASTVAGVHSRKYSCQLLMCSSARLFFEIASTKRCASWMLVMSGMPKSAALR